MADLIGMLGLRRAVRLRRGAWAASLRRDGVQVGPGVQLYGRPVVTRAPTSSLRIGARSVLISQCRRNAVGVNHAVVLRTLLPGARLNIGEDVGMSGASICAAVSVSIGDGTMLGANVMIVDTDFHELDSRHRRYLPMPSSLPHHCVEIGRNVFIGANAVVLKGVTIGDDAVVGAGAVVTTSVPAGGLCIGNPGRLVSRRTRSAQVPLEDLEMPAQRRDGDELARQRMPSPWPGLP